MVDINELNEDDVMVKADIVINKAISHTLDTDQSKPILSSMFLNTSEHVGDYLQKHVEKAMKDSDLKRTSFLDHSSFLPLIKEYQKTDSLINSSKDISEIVFAYMLEHVEIPAGDLVFVDFNFGLDQYLGIFKFNYQRGYIHDLNNKGGVNDILVQPRVLPTEKQKLDEFVIIGLSDYRILLKEKEYVIDGHKDVYWSSQILFCEDTLSEKKALSIVEKAIKHTIESVYHGSYEKANKARDVMISDYEKGGSLRINTIADALFETDENTKEQFKNTVKQSGLNDDSVSLSPHIEKKLYEKQKFITDSGIEISIPLEVLDKKNIIDFKQNTDGTVSIKLSNITLLTQK